MEREVPTEPVLPEERLEEPVLRDAVLPVERAAAEAPERLTLAALVAEDAREVDMPDDALRPAEEVRTEEVRVVAPLLEAEEAEERVAADRLTPLRAWEELPRMEEFPSRCPTDAAREGSKR